MGEAGLADERGCCVKNRPEQTPAFFVDETTLEIEGKKHFLIVAITFDDPQSKTTEIIKIKKALGIALSQEVKWNQQSLPAQVRYKLSDGMLSAVSDSTVLVSIIEGNDKEKACEFIVRQIADYSERPFSVYLDRNLCPNVKKLWDFSVSLPGPAQCVSLQEVESSREQLVQCVDVFAGLFKTAIEHIVKGVNKSRQCYDPISDNEYEDSIVGYIFEIARFCLPGDVDFCTPTLDGEVIPPEPFKDAWGCGIRLESSISDRAKDVIRQRVGSWHVGAEPERQVISRIRASRPTGLNRV